MTTTAAPGVFVETLPGWASALAWLLPLTHAVNLTRGFHRGVWDPALLPDVAWIVIATALFLWLAVRLLERRIVK